MANPVQALNENFSYNSMLVRALIQLMPAKERESIHPWLHILHEMNDSPEEMIIRNEYMWFLLVQLQNKHIMEPFNHPPSSRNLLPLKQLLPTHIYEGVIATNERNVSLMEPEVAVGNQSNVEKSLEPKVKIPEGFSAPPAQFLANQPIPENGIICYMAAFSDQT